jgi:hypothetical protein
MNEVTLKQSFSAAAKAVVGFEANTTVKVLKDGNFKVSVDVGNKEAAHAFPKIVDAAVLITRGKLGPDGKVSKSVEEAYKIKAAVADAPTEVATAIDGIVKADDGQWKITTLEAARKGTNCIGELRPRGGKVNFFVTK